MLINFVLLYLKINLSLQLFIIIFKKIIIGGRNKYLINGHNAQQHNVANLFQSVQLNVNNPHFLIMQGKITQVLNMKPPEILAMIEEAAGTRMFEEKKKKAKETMAKKDKKLEEISSLKILFFLILLLIINFNSNIKFNSMTS